MKCISKKRKISQFWKEVLQNSKKPLKGHSQRRKKIKKTLILLGVLAVFILAGTTALVLFIRIFGTSVQESSLAAEGMAGSLCVGESDNALDGVEGQEGEMTGLFDIHEGEIPFSQDLYGQKSPGRLAQLMTVLVAYENLDLTESITVESEDIPYGLDQTCGLASENVIPARPGKSSFRK